MSRYKIVEELGRGGMGVVYRACHVDLGREVALKLVLGQVSDCDGDDVKRFHREVKICAELSHPNIVRVFDSGEIDGRPYYTMEIVDGTDLHHLVKKGPQPLDEVLEAVIQAADALAYVHEKGMVHRDIKPQNIMRRADGRITVMDFGLARLPTSTVLTRQGAVVGTPRYMAPECLRESEPSPAADVYALALTAHELLAGKSWSTATGDIRTLAAEILSGAPPSLAGVRDDVPGWLLKVQAAALCKDPKARLTAAQYRDALRQAGARADAGTAPRTARITRPVQARRTVPVPVAPPPPARGRAAPLALIVSLLAAAGLVASFALRPPAPRGGGPASPSPAAARAATAVLPLDAFACYPSEHDLQIVFDLVDRDGAAVEVGRADDRAVRWRKAVARGALTTAIAVDDMAPDTEYFVRVTATSGRRLVDDFKVRTRPAAHAKLVAETVAGFASSGNSGAEFFQLMQYYPDRRGQRLIEEALAARRLATEEFEKAANVAFFTRNARLVDLLWPHAGAAGTTEDGVATILRAAGGVLDRRVIPVAHKALATSAHADTLLHAAYALARLEGAAACDRIAGAIERKVVFDGHVAHTLGLASPACARARASDWAAGAGTHPYGIIHACWTLAGEPDVALIARIARRPGAWSEERTRAARALCEIGSPAARRAVAEIFDEQPDREDMIWAAGYLGVGAAAPKLAARLVPPHPVSRRRAAACALGLVGGAGEGPHLTAALDDADASVADAAAWALGARSDAGAVAALLKRATSASDARGAAAWALGMMRAKAAAKPLADLALALPMTTRSAQTRLAVIAWALGQLQDPVARPALDRLAGPGPHKDLRQFANRARNALDAQAPDDAVSVLPLSPVTRTGLRLAAGQSVGVEGIQFLVGDPTGQVELEHKPELAVFAGFTFHEYPNFAIRVLSRQDAEVIVRPFGACEVDRPAVPLDRVAGLALLRLTR